LTPHGKSILEAARFYVKHLDKKKSCRVEKLLESFLSGNEAQGEFDRFDPSSGQA
jgi:hypothetical protein